MPIKNIDGFCYISNEEKTKTFAKYLEENFQPKETSEILVTDEISQEQPEIWLFTLQEVQNEIKHLNLKKALVYHLTTGEVLLASL